MYTNNNLSFRLDLDNAEEVPIERKEWIQRKTSTFLFLKNGRGILKSKYKLCPRFYYYS